MSWSGSPVAWGASDHSAGLRVDAGSDAPGYTLSCHDRNSGVHGGAQAWTPTFEGIAPRASWVLSPGPVDPLTPTLAASACASSAGLVAAFQIIVWSLRIVSNSRHRSPGSALLAIHGASRGSRKNDSTLSAASSRGRSGYALRSSSGASAPVT